MAIGQTHFMRILFKKYQHLLATPTKLATENLEADIKNFLDRLDLETPNHLPELFETLFEMLAKKPSSWKIEKIEDFTFSVRPKWTPTTRKTLIISGIHGNEIGGIVASMYFAKWLCKNTFPHPAQEFIFCLGNIEAIRQGKRFIHKDLNRCFHLENERLSLAFNENHNEVRESQRIARVIKQASVVIDLHQTVQPTLSAFLCTIKDRANIQLISEINMDIPVLTYDNDFSQDGWTTENYSQNYGIPALTLETGQTGLDQKQISLTQKFLMAYLRKSSWNSLSSKTSCSIMETEQVILQNPTRSIQLVHGFKNFSRIKSGQIIAFDSQSQTSIQSKVTGYLLFPKYGELAKSSSELAMIVSTKPIS